MSGLKTGLSRQDAPTHLIITLKHDSLCHRKSNKVNPRLVGHLELSRTINHLAKSYYYDHRHKDERFYHLTLIDY